MFEAVAVIGTHADVGMHIETGDFRASLAYDCGLGILAGTSQTQYAAASARDLKLVNDACQVTGKGITETLVAGLERVKRSAAASEARALKGKLHLTVDIETSRERDRH